MNGWILVPSATGASNPNRLFTVMTSVALDPGATAIVVELALIVIAGPGGSIVNPSVRKCESPSAVAFTIIV